MRFGVAWGIGVAVTSNLFVHSSESRVHVKRSCSLKNMQRGIASASDSPRQNRFWLWAQADWETVDYLTRRSRVGLTGVDRGRMEKETGIPSETGEN